MALLRIIGYLLIVVIVITVIVKKTAGPRCHQCQKRVGKQGILRSVYGEEQILCRECNNRMKANESVPDFNNM